MNPDSIGTVLKRAFLWHWHLLGLGVAGGFAVLSGQFGTFLPFLAAGEIAYLGMLGVNPRFQNVLKGVSMTKDLPKAPPTNDLQRFQKLASFLSPEDLSRFQNLHARCSALRDLRRAMDAKDQDDGAENFRGDSLNRMLWLFLKLLHQKSGLQRFLASTQRGQIEFDLKEAREQLAKAKQRDTTTAGGVESRLTTSITERISTIEERLTNFDQTGENLELVSSEIDKTEQQIIHLCEVGMTSRDSAGLSAQVDSISESLQASEKAFAHESIETLFEGDDAPALFGGTINVTTPAQLRPLVRQ